jgi:signal transduction histidine kinase
MAEKEGYILIGVTLAVLLVFLVTFFLILLLYRKRRMQHHRSAEMMKEQHIREMLSSQLEMQQQTMQHIGREIHDNIGQKLTLAALYTQRLSMKNEYPAIKDHIDGIAQIINDSLNELRSLSKDLTSNYIHQTSLHDLIRLECDKVNGLDSCKAVCTFNDEGVAVTDAIKTIILRVVQEFMQNSLKHSGCSRICIELQSSPSGLALLASDDGGGFDTAETRTGEGGIGFTNMQRRAGMIGALFTIQSAPGKGTRMEMLIPPEKLNL